MKLFSEEILTSYLLPYSSCVPGKGIWTADYVSLYVVVGSSEVNLLKLLNRKLKIDLDGMLKQFQYKRLLEPNIDVRSIFFLFLFLMRL